MNKTTKDFLNASLCMTMGFRIIMPVFLCLVFTSCSPKTQYIPRESVTLRTDTVYSVKVRVDSVKSVERIFESDNRHDSVAPILDSLNRVIGWDRYHFREVTKKDSREIRRLQSLVDSLKSSRVDSVEKPVPYPVERPLTKWEQTKMDFGGFALGGVAVVLCIAVAWLIKKFRK